MERFGIFKGMIADCKLGAVDCEEYDVCEYFEEEKLFCVPWLEFEECEKYVLALDLGDVDSGAPDQVL